MILGGTYGVGAKGVAVFVSFQQTFLADLDIDIHIASTWLDDCYDTRQGEQEGDESHGRHFQVLSKRYEAKVELASCKWSSSKSDECMRRARTCTVRNNRIAKTPCEDAVIMEERAGSGKLMLKVALG